MRGDDAKEKCPEIILVKGKQNLNLVEILSDTIKLVLMLIFGFN